MQGRRAPRSCGSCGNSETWKTTIYEGHLKADREVWSDPCKHQLSQRVNLARSIISFPRLLSSCFGADVGSGAESSGPAGRSEEPCSLPFPRLPVRATLVRSITGRVQFDAPGFVVQACKRARAHLGTLHTYHTYIHTYTHTYIHLALWLYGVPMSLYHCATFIKPHMLIQHVVVPSFQIYEP